MIEQIPNTNPVPLQPSFKGDMKVIVDKIKQSFGQMGPKFTQTKFYTNKKILWLIGLVFGLLLLIIIIGLIFGKKGGSETGVSPTQTPASQATPEASPGQPNSLTEIEQKLSDLKTQINDLDVKQSRLQPPNINFKISF